MDIKMAKATIENAIKTRTDELAVLQLASDILNENFKAEFTTLEIAQKEANDGVVILNSRNGEIEGLKAVVMSKDAEIEDKVDTITTLQTEKEELQQKVKDLTPVDEVKPTENTLPVDEPIE
jgi:chromosome segregation ATPase